MMEERRLASAMAGVAPVARELCGGIMARGEPGSWMNKAIAIGLGSPVHTSDLETLIAFYAEAAIEPRVEIPSFAEPGLLDLLAGAGFVLRRIAHCLATPLPSGPPPAGRAPEGFSIELVDPADDAAVRRFAETSALGFAPQGRAPTSADVELWGKTLGRAGTIGIVARHGARPVAAGCADVRPPYATLFGLSVRPDFRRRGLQRAMIDARLQAAAARGARFATITSDPGGPTERNALRCGFAPAYTRLILVRPGPGLAPVG